MTEGYRPRIPNPTPMDPIANRLARDMARALDTIDDKHPIIPSYTYTPMDPRANEAARRMAYHLDRGKIRSNSPEREQGLSKLEKLGLVAAVALASFGIFKVFSMGEKQPSEPVNSGDKTEQSTTPNTIMIPTDEDPTIWEVAGQVHKGDRRDVVDNIIKLRGGSDVVQPHEQVPVLVSDINRDMKG